jgi:hypothetical protein
MSVCPSCIQPNSDPGALFCPYCGFALPAGRPPVQGSPVLAAETARFAGETNPAQPRQRPAWAAQENPRAVAVGLGALAAAVILAVMLSYGSGSSGDGRPARLAAAPSLRANAALPPRSRPVASRHQRSRPDAAAVAPPQLAHLTPYRASGYSFAYPSGWQVSRSDQPITTYRQTVLQSSDGAAKVNVDYSPGETTDPASKASQVEAATRSTTPGYRRIAFRSTAVEGHAAFAWEFVVADTDPRRADLFVRVPGGEFALLAHGVDLARARAAARSIAGSVSATN